MCRVEMVMVWTAAQSGLKGNAASAMAEETDDGEESTLMVDTWSRFTV